MIENGLIQILDKKNTIIGSGFIISGNIAVTCAHVIESARSTKGEYVKIRFFSNQTVQRAIVLPDGWSSPQNDDIAFLALSSIPSSSIQFSLTSAFNHEGHNFISVGFAQIEDYQLCWVNGKIGGVVSVKNNNKRPTLQLIGANIKEGMSGAPIVIPQTEMVVGMVSEYLIDSLLSYSWATTSDTLASLNENARKSLSSTIIDNDLILKPNQPIKAEELLSACKEQVKMSVNSLSQKYDPNLYIDRSIEGTIESFLNPENNYSSKNCYLLIAPAGSGKTNLLCDFASRKSNQQPVLLLTGGNIFIDDKLGLLGAINNEIAYTNENIIINSPSSGLHLLHKLALYCSKSSLIIIDAINEYENPIFMKKAIKNLLMKSQNMKVKFIISCRDYFWGVYEDEFWDDYVFNNRSRTDINLEEANNEFYFFTESEQIKAIDLYLRHYEITGKPIETAREQCRHPLLLRFFCEAYRGLDIGDVKDIRLKELFDLYWEKKIESITNRMNLPGKERHHKGISRKIADYLLNLAKFMLDTETRSVEFDMLPVATKSDEQSDDPRSIFGRVRDEYIILEKILKKGKDLEEFYVSFVYEEFMEYTMARSLLRYWEESDLHNSQILSSIELLIQKHQNFAQVLGCFVYLAIMVKEEKNIDVWAALFNKGEKWQKVVFETIRKLPEKELDQNVFFELERMLTGGNTEIINNVLGLLSIDRISRKMPESIVRLLCENYDSITGSKRLLIIRSLANSSHSKISIPYLIKLAALDNGVFRNEAERSISNLTKLKNNKSVICSCLLENLHSDDNLIRHYSSGELIKYSECLKSDDFEFAVHNPDLHVRGNILLVLKQNGDSKAIKMLIGLLSDNSSLIRSNSAQALGEIGSIEAISPLITKLKDRNPKVRSAVAIALGRIGDNQVVDRLVLLLDDPNIQVRVSSISALAYLNDDKTVELLAQLLNDNNVEIKLSAMKALSHLKDKRVLPMLNAQIKNSNDCGEILELLNILENYEIDDTYTNISEFLEFPIILETPQLLSKVISLLKNSKNDQIKLLILNKLKGLIYMNEARFLYLIPYIPQLDNFLSIPIMIELAKHNDVSVRKTTIKAMGNVKNEEIIKILISCLKDENAGVVRTAAESLAALGNYATNLLHDAMNEKHPIVQLWVKNILNINDDSERNEDTSDGLFRPLKSIRSRRNRQRGKKANTNE